MTQETDAVFDSALSLPPETRAALAERLLESLDDQDRSEIDAAWMEEAERRLRDYKDGKVRSIPADEVLRSAASNKKR